MAEERHEHEGSFASGTEKSEHHPEREGERGRFAKGKGEEHAHEGSFAEGQERREHHPEREERGRFSRGEEKDR